MIERLLVQIETLALQNDMPVILVADLETVGLAYACLRSERTHLLCRPGHTALAAALLATARQTPSRSLHAANRDNEGERKSVVWGKRRLVRVVLGGGRYVQTK